MSILEDIQIIKVKENNLKACSRIMAEEYNKPPYNETWEEETAVQRLAELMERSPETCFIIQRDSNLIGFIFCSIETTFIGKSFYVNEFAISSENQGKGIGTKVINWIEMYAKKNNIVNVAMDAYIYSPAYTFYKKRGFKESDFRYLSKEIK